jgi:hypothetical protein
MVHVPPTPLVPPAPVLGGWHLPATQLTEQQSASAAQAPASATQVVVHSPAWH